MNYVKDIKWVLYRERDEIKRQRHIQKLDEFELYGDITLFADECGIQEDLVREKGKNEHYTIGRVLRYQSRC